ncbi:MAG: hypothetical protein ACRD5J_18710 [Nitrososphaeraceae archaeon]
MSYTLIKSYRTDLVGITSGGLDVATIGLLVTIVVAIITAACIIIKLHFRVKYLEKHPIIEAVDEVNKEDAIEFYRSMRDKSRSRGV